MNQTVILVIIIIIIAVMVFTRRKIQTDSKKLQTSTYEKETTEVTQSEYTETVDKPSFPEPTTEQIEERNKAKEVLSTIGDTIIDLSKNPVFWGAIGTVTLGPLLVKKLPGVFKKVAPKLSNKIAKSVVGKISAKIATKFSTTVVAKVASLASRFGISIAKASTVIGIGLAIFDLFTIGLDIGDLAGPNGPGYARMGSNKTYLAMRDESLKKLKEEISKNGGTYPIYLSNMDSVSKEEIEANTDLIVSDIMNLNRVPIHPLAENMLNAIKEDILNGKLTETSLEDTSVFEKYLNLVDENLVELEILGKLCEKYSGKLVNGQCSFTSKEQCQKWPIKDNENYAEWKDNACFLADDAVRRACDENKIEYDVNTGSCKVDADYCLMKGSDWRDNDCYINPGQEFGEFILGTTITRGLRQVFDPKMYESCREGEIDDGYFCRKLSCPDDKPEEFAGSCYPKCKPGYQGASLLCWESCPEDYIEEGVFCRKPIDTVAKSSYFAKKKPCAAGLRDDGTSCWSGFYNKTWGSVNCQANMCIDLDSGKSNNGEKVQLWDCDANNQNQKLTYDAGTGELKFNKTGKCLEIAGNSKDNWAQAQQWDCIGSDSQKWDRDREQFRNRNSGKCLNVRNGQAVNGNWLQQYDCNENDISNKWEEHIEGDSKFYKSRITTKPFRVEGYSDCYSTWINQEIKTTVFDRQYCDDGDKNVAGVCYKPCPPGYVDNGLLCSTGGQVITRKNYGRGVGQLAGIQSRVKGRKIAYSSKDN